MAGPDRDDETTAGNGTCMSIVTTTVEIITL